MTDVHTAARAAVRAWDEATAGRLMVDLPGVAEAMLALGQALGDEARADAARVLNEAGKARRTDPATSHRAARVVRGQQRHRVLADVAAHRTAGRTAYEVGEALGILRTAAGTRLGELARWGLVGATFDTRPTDTGHEATVYRITTAGLDVLAGLNREDTAHAA